MRSISLKRRALSSTALLVAIAFLPLQAVDAPKSAAATLSAGRPDKLAPLGAASPAKKSAPEMPAGDFGNAPNATDPRTAHALDKTTPGDHFKQASSLIDQTVNSNTYDNGDGTASVDTYTSPINFRDATGKWQAIDSRLSLQNGKVRNGNGPAAIELSPTTTGTGLGKLTVGANSLSFGATGIKTAKQGSISEGSITYPDAFTNSDLRYNVLGSKLKESIVVKSPGSPLGYNFPLTLNGLHGVTKSDGAVVFQDKTNNEVIAVDKGVAWDAAGARSTVSITLSAAANALDVKPDANWMSDPSRVYPITIDPTFDAGLDAGQSDPSLDAYVASATPNTGYNGVSGQWTGSTYVDKAGIVPGNSDYHTYMYLKTSPMNGKQILDAKLKIYTYSHMGSSDNLTMHPVSGSWSPNTITWNSAPAYIGTSISVAPPINSYSDIDMTTWVQNWTGGAWANNGLEFESANTSYYLFGATENQGLGGQAPYIHVTYNTQVTPGRLSAPANTSVVTSTTPTLTGTTGTDPDGQTLWYWFRASTTDDPERGGLVNSGWLSSPSWTVPAGLLKDGVTYSWEMYTSDGYWMPRSYGWKFKVNLRLGSQSVTPMDTEGPVGVNMATGNVTFSTASPTFKTVGGDVGLSYSYNSQAPIAQSGLAGRYWPGCGAAIDPNTCPTPAYINRTDPQIDFRWGNGSPGNGITDDVFRAQWKGNVTVPSAATYCFETVEDDGVKVTVGTTTLVNRWTDHSQSTVSWAPGNADCIVFSAGALTKTITVDYYENTGGANIQLWTKAIGGPTIIVPTSWLTTSQPSLPQGWQLSASTDAGVAYVRAQISDSNIVLIDGDGITSEFRRQDPANPNAGYIAPIDDKTVLTNAIDTDSSPVLVAQSPDGMTYTFDSAGNLKRLRSTSDSLHPAAADYGYDASIGFGRLNTITDPVSGRAIGLHYGGESACNDTIPSGFDTSYPSGMLCRIDYWDSTHTSFFYLGGQLGRIVDPGSEITDFSYNSGLLNGVADPLQMDYRANHTTSGAYTRVNYLGAKASSVVLASPNGSDGTDIPPTTNRPWHAYTYNTGSSDLAIGGLSPTQGYTRRVYYDSATRTTQDVDSTGVSTYNEWSVADNLLSARNGATNRKTTTFYDSQNRVTDSYGPAPQECFVSDPNNANYRRPVGIGVTGCADPTIVAHSSTGFDEGINGLSVSWFSNSNLAGAPAAHSTKIRQRDNDGSINEDYSLWGNQNFNLGNQSTNWSFRATGEMNFNTVGTYNLNLYVAGAARMWIDDKLVVDSWTQGAFSSRNGTFVNTVAGWHRVRYEYAFTTGTAASINVVYVLNGNTVYPPSIDYRPDYGLATTSTTDDSTIGSPAHVTTTGYGTLGGSLDPVYSIAQSMTEDAGSGHLNLTSASSYETPGTSGFLRKTSRTLPAGNSYSYSYFGNTEAATGSCPGATVTNQGGLMKTRTSPAPQSGAAVVENFIYDVDGRVTASWRDTDSPTCITYDGRGRVATKVIPDSTSRTVTYNYAVGNDALTTSVSDPIGTITTVSDLLGRQTSYTDVWGRATTTTYDLASRVTDTNATGDVRHIDYDTSGRVSAQKAGPSSGSLVAVATPTYNPANELTHVDYSNSTGVDVTRDSVGRTSSLSYKKGATSITADGVTYSQSGRIVDQSIDGTDPYGSGNNFAYDAVGRLIAARVPGHSYAYGFAATACSGTNVDNNAFKNTNRTSVSDNGTTTANYCYDNADRLTSTTDSRYGSVVYDSHGNTTTLGTSTMIYDMSDRHMSTADGSTNVVYTRDALDRVVARTNGTTITHYSFAGSGDSPSAVLDSSNNVVDLEISLLGGVIEDIRGATTTWSYPNIHGDVVATADASGNKQGPTTNYDPFGLSLNTAPDNVTANFDYGWLGQHERGLEHEGSLNTIEMGARQYVPGLGRFIEVDPVEGGCANDYSYVHGDPISATDLDGKVASCRSAISSSPYGYLAITARTKGAYTITAHNNAWTAGPTTNWGGFSLTMSINGKLVAGNTSSDARSFLQDFHSYQQIIGRKYSYARPRSHVEKRLRRRIQRGDILTLHFFAETSSPTTVGNIRGWLTCRL